MAQFREILRHLFCEGVHTINKVPPHESDQHPEDEAKKLKVLTYKPEATFRWPPDCLWPFMGYRPTSDT
jgi:hypothetical protein